MWRRIEMEIAAMMIWSKSDLEIMINTSIWSVNRRKLTVERNDAYVLFTWLKNNRCKFGVLLFVCMCVVERESGCI